MTTPTMELRVTCDQALAIAHADVPDPFRDPFRYQIEVRLEPNGWIVVYHFRKKARFEVGGGAYYVIHPESGDIISKTYHQ